MRLTQTATEVPISAPPPRDNRRFTYCTIEVSEDDFVLDHLVPVIKGGRNRKTDLVTFCAASKQRKQDVDPIEFLLQNYRSKLLDQEENLRLKERIEAQWLDNDRNTSQSFCRGAQKAAPAEKRCYDFFC